MTRITVNSGQHHSSAAGAVTANPKEYHSSGTGGITDGSAFEGHSSSYGVLDRHTPHQALACLGLVLGPVQLVF